MRNMAFGLLLFVLLGAAPSPAAEITRFRFQVRDLAGSPVEVVHVGDEFELQVHLRDVRPEPLGILSAYLDVEYDPRLVSHVSDSVVFGDQFGVITSGSTSAVGVLDEMGSFANGILEIPPVPRLVGAQETLLLSARFRAVQVGSATFTGNPADTLPLHSITVLGLDDAVAVDDVYYDAVDVTIIPEPTSFIIAGGGAYS